MNSTLRNILLTEKSSRILGLFRILFGILFLIHFSVFSKSSNFKFYYVDTSFHFTFPGLDFVQPLGGELMMLIHIVNWITILFFVVGFMYRFAALFLFLSMAYLELIDVAYHNNHNYVIILFLLFFAVTGANRSFSLDKSIFKLEEKIPSWQTSIFIFQLFIIYFYGGIAKLNSDWLSGDVMSEMLSYSFPEKSANWLAGFGFFITYIGLVFDLAIVPLLVWKKTRWIALTLVLIFNLSNAYIFHIGIFPFLMIASCLFFFEDKIFAKQALPKKHAVVSKLTKVMLATFVIFQLLIPFKHYFIPGNVHWTGEGYFISWQMKSFTKVSQIEFMMVDSATGDQYLIPLDKALLSEQQARLSYFPVLAKQFADFMEQDARSKGIENVEVYTLFGSSLNGGPLRVVIDQDIDLTEVEVNTFGHSNWINLYE